MNENELLKLCKALVAEGMNMGADAIEVLANSSKEVVSSIQMAEVAQVRSIDAAEVAIRLFIAKRMGSAFTNISTLEAGREALELALSAARVTTPDEDWVSLPASVGTYSTLTNFWYDEVANSDPSQVVDITKNLIEAGAKSEPGLIPVGGASGAISYMSAYANSNDVEHAQKGTVSYGSLAAVAPTETGMTPGTSFFELQRNLNLDIDKIVQPVAETIRLCKKTAKGKTGKHTVILHPRAYAQIFQNTLVQSVRGDNVARGTSKIADKIGAKIASDSITIVDDGLHPRGIASSEADDEGVPRKKTPIIEKGVLRSFLWDTYWANKMGVSSTGNASRNMRRGLVEISKTTFVYEPGTRDIEKIISEIDHGYYIHNVQGAHSANPESGDFSIVGNPAILIEDGKLVGAVHGLMLAGNTFDILNKVKEIAKTPIHLLGTIGPEIVIEDLSVVAKED
jgi:PmbA protein